jgi:D-methionine transport system substrate-binding protein
MKKILCLTLALILTLSLVSLVGCKQTESDEKTIVVGASPTPHAEILNQVKDTLAAEGYTLVIREFDDYVLPNKALADKELDANYFQHTPFLNSYNEANGTDLVAAALIHYEPFGLFGNGVASVADIASDATILIPADDSNETRALLLLAQEGLITIKDGKNVSTGVTTLDIEDAKGHTVTAIAADTVAAQLKNSDAGTVAVINGNYALGAGLKIADALAVESVEGEAAQTYANIIAVRKGDENSEKIQALIKALKTAAVKEYIEKQYNGAVQPMFTVE